MQDPNSTLSDEQLLHFRAKLEALRNEILTTEQHLEQEALLDLSEERTGEISHVRTHPADLGTAEFDHEVELSVADRETVEIQDIEAALLRIHERSYGRCLNCGRPIPVARLEAQPQAAYCVACEREMEAQNRP